MIRMTTFAEQKKMIPDQTFESFENFEIYWFYFLFISELFTLLSKFKLAAATTTTTNWIYDILLFINTTRLELPATSLN